ncbi:signal transduction histidine kinase [Desulfitispora alkaliphila]|uniref:LytS/YhcK type 5TM receptor domain-containing protein n=1 Tax=Desulfitispora alkaliphila TaxID=622674 RepID=UPI003D222AEC
MANIAIIMFTKDLILNMTLVVALTYLISQTNIIHILRKTKLSIKEMILVTTTFGLMSTLALFFGVQYGDLTANMRYIPGIVGGIYAGPIVGVGSLAISGVFRLMEVGGIRGFFMGITMGLAAGILGRKSGRDINFSNSLKITVTCMAIHFLFIVATEVDLTTVYQMLVELMWLIYLLNTLGVMIFLYIIQQEFRREDQKKALAGLAIMEERDRIAKDLHDGFAQTLFFLNTKNAILKKLIIKGETEKSLKELEQIKLVIKDCFTDIRQTIFNLKNIVDPDIDFATILENYAEKFQNQHNIRVHYVYNLNEKISFALEKEIHLMRIIQEALNNVLKHAEANKVIISFQEEDVEHLVLIVADDGKGIKSESDNSARKKFGLLNMQERAWSIGADFKIESNPGEGTKVIVKLPKSLLKEGKKSGTS